MTRYPHYITRQSRGRNPRVILCLDARAEPYTDPVRPEVRYERLLLWTTTALYRSGPEYRIGWSMSSERASEWWRLLADMSDTPGTIWVVSHGACRLWSLLGLWEEMEHERFILPARIERGTAAYQDAVRRMRLSGDDPLRLLSASGLSRMLSRGVGSFIAQDCPSLVSGRLPGRPARVMWLDSRNYGIERPDAVATGYQAVAWLASLMQRIVRACHQYRLGPLQATAGAQAMVAWRTNYLSEGVYCHVNPGATEAESHAYCGGRAEAFRVGPVRSPVWHFDYRSQYASVCQDTRLPIRLQSHDRNPCREDAVAAVLAGCAIARVALETDEPAYPYRREEDVIYPVGRFTTTLAGPELSDALGMHRIRAFMDVLAYDMGQPLRSYALEMYKMRCDADQSHDNEIASLAKRLYCSLPGKLAQRSHIWTPTNMSCDGVLYGEWLGSRDGAELCRYRSIGGTVFREDDAGLSEDANLAIAAWITSEARVRLLRAIRTAGWENTYYVDTDGLLVSEYGARRLEASNLFAPGRAGHLQAKARHASVCIHGIKRYVADGQSIGSGPGSGNVQPGSTGGGVIVSPKPGDDAGRGRRPEYRELTIPWQQVTPYHHGIVGSDGRVTPIRLEEW